MWLCGILIMLFVLAATDKLRVEATWDPKVSWVKYVLDIGIGPRGLRLSVRPLDPDLDPDKSCIGRSCSWCFGTMRSHGPACRLNTKPPEAP